MVHKPISNGLHPPTKLPVDAPPLEVVLNFLALVQANQNQTLELSRAFEILNFQIGDELINYHAKSLLNNLVEYEQEVKYFYIVSQGRVRLLGFDSQRQREVPTLVLEAGAVFGAEHLWGHQTQLTRALAASDCQVARIPINQLKQQLEKLPQLGEYLNQQAKQRQCIVFFKTSTSLRSLSSYQLQQLLPYLVETQINRGESIADSTPPGSGLFWLCQGQIQSQSGKIPPTVGQSWGDPKTKPEDWIAETDLLAYQLPEENWPAALSIAPVLAATLGQTNATGNLQHRSSAAARRSQSSPITVVDNRHAASSQASPENPVNNMPQSVTVGTGSPEAKPVTKQERNVIIAFPKPAKQWHRNRWLKQGFPYIGQQSERDCGATCLAMISRYWGKNFGLNYLRNLAHVGRSGATLKNLAKAAESLGFQARPVRASLNPLLSQSHPWIAHWEGDHYVVVYRVKGDRLLIADPAMGKRSLSHSEFLAGWTGYALLLDPTDRLRANEDDEKISLGRFWKGLLPYRSIMAQILLLSLLLQVFGLVTPMFTQIILDSVVVQKSFSTLNVFAIGLLLFGIWRIGLVAVRQYLLDYFSNRLDLTFISGFINHTLRLPLKFFEMRQVGDIVTRVQENQKIQIFLTRQAISAWLDASMAIVYVGLMFYYNWQLTLLVLSLIPPIIILTVVASPILRAVSREIFKETAGQNSSLVEMITGVATVKASSAEREMRWLWEERLTGMLNARFKGQKLSNSLQIMSGLINSLGSTALLWYGASLVIQDRLTIGQFVAFNMLIGNVINPILALVGLWDRFQEVLVSVERLNDVFSTQPEENPQKPMLVLPRLRGEVMFENMTFRYGDDDERNTLQNLSFEVHPGQTIAIVGRSGSGKSTLVKLLQGLYYPKSGRIWIDGHDIQHVSPTSLRSQLGVVPQECFLFSGTILENITLYRPEFTLEQAIEVAKLAEAHAFIQSLPLGYNTKVGERGSNLSGGQRQRIAIARALLGDPRILILDEATSSLDTESERRFQQNLARISRDRTTFIIAHRLSTVRNADSILVLDRGVLAEQGTHEQLMLSQGLYYHLAQQQLNL